VHPAAGLLGGEAAV